MPLNLLDNMPEALRRESSALYRFSMNSGEPRLPQSATGSSMLYTSREHFEQSPTIAVMNQRSVSLLNDLLFPVLVNNGCYVLIPKILLIWWHVNRFACKLACTWVAATNKEQY